jgi:hypothetical protein
MWTTTIQRLLLIDDTIDRVVRPAPIESSRKKGGRKHSKRTKMKGERHGNEAKGGGEWKHAPTALAPAEGSPHLAWPKRDPKTFAGHASDLRAPFG